MKKERERKPYWKMTTEELADATKAFDDPNYNPPATKPTASQRKQLQQWHRKRAEDRSRLTLSLDKTLIEQTDNYAANHGMTFADVVTDALQRFIHKPSA